MALLSSCGETPTLSLKSCDVRNCSSIRTLSIGNKDLHSSENGLLSVEYNSWARLNETASVNYGIRVNGEYLGNTKGNVTVGNCYPLENEKFLLVDSRSDQSEIDYCILGE